LLRLFKSKLFILLFVTVVILSVMGISARQDSIVNRFGGILNAVMPPFQRLFSISGQKSGAFISFFRDTKAIRMENEQLKIKVDNLEKENNELKSFKEENKELKAVLNLKDQFNSYDFIGANITAKDMGNWFNVFTVDRGSRDGIAKDFPVITGKGLVGKVFSAGSISSKVISIIDVDSTVSARISKTRDYVRVKGDINLKNKGLCVMDYIPLDVDVEVGDTVETSGIGGIFPKGIIIGSVKEIRQTSSEMNRYAIIEPAVDFQRLEDVFILKSKSE